MPGDINSINLKELFANPPAGYAIYPIVHSNITNEKKIEELKKSGFGGLVANVAYNQNYPDNDVDWENFARAAKKAADNGLNLWIYDEKGYPSGTAGGAVLERDPGLETVGLVVYNYWKTLTGPSRYRADTPEGTLFKALLVPLAGNNDPVDITMYADENGTLRFEIPRGGYRLLVFVVRRLFDGTHAAHSYSEPRRYINLLDSRATDKFINVTHEKYKEYTGGLFGSSIKAFFTDEPSLISWNLESMPYAMISWRNDFPEVFKQKYGYEIELALTAVFLNTGNDIIRRRCDFWELISTELANNFFGRIRSWCRENNIMASGHLLAEEELTAHVFLYGSYYASMKMFDIPGIDQLESEPEKLMHTDRLPIGRLAASFADVYGLGEAMTEASDHTSRMGNRQIPYEWIKASMNWHHAQGINIITSYYSFAQLNFQQTKDLNAFVARLGLILRQGRRYSRVAVLYPECSIWSEVTPVPEAKGGRQPQTAVEISRIFREVSWGLLQRQVDFDYIDENVITDGKITDDKLTYGDRSYEALILPGVHVLKLNTARKLSNYMKAGGKVLALGSIPSLSREGCPLADIEIKNIFVNRPGESEISMQRFLFSALPGIMLTTGIIDFLPRTFKLEPKDVFSVSVGAAGTIIKTGNDIPSPWIMSHTRILEDGRKVIFLANMSGKAYSGVLNIAGNYSKDSDCEIWDPESGTDISAEFQIDGGGLKVRVELGAYRSLFYII